MHLVLTVAAMKIPPTRTWRLREPLLDAEQTAVLLGIPRSSVYAYAKRGEDDDVKIGKHLKFVRQDLEQALIERRAAERSDARPRSVQLPVAAPTRSNPTRGCPRLNEAGIHRRCPMATTRTSRSTSTS